MASSLDGKMLVAAIDFGTAYSGYAYSMRTTYRTDPLKIEINSWTGEGLESMSFKAPSTILLNPDKTFHSFGYKAEEKYAELAEEGTHSDWFYITKFKMKLLNKEEIERNATIPTEDGKPVSGFDVLSMALNFMRKHLMDTLDRKGLGVRNEDVFWVITVPAIWSDAAKQFTREAFEKAGISKDSLVFAYEPEAAALYCKTLPIQTTQEVNSGQATFTKGKTIMVVDVGGGTADISVLEVVDEKKMNIVEKATGGPWGGVTIDTLFYRFLNAFWGEEVIEELKSTLFSDYLILCRVFENKKRLINIKDKVPLCLEFSRNFKKLFERITKQKFADMEMKKEHMNHIKMDGYDMEIDCDYVYKEFFLPIVDNIVKTSKNILKKQIKRTISSVVLVGGLSQCKTLVDAMRKELNIPVFVPTDAGIAVLKGAVLYGHDQNVIKQRICKYTYGVRTMRKYEEGHEEGHHEGKTVYQEGKRWVKDCFRPFYEASDTIKLGDIRNYTLHDTFKDSNRRSKRTEPIRCDLFVSSEARPRYVTDEGCRLLGHIIIEPPKGGFPDEWKGEVEMEFAGTEIIGRVKHGSEVTTARFDFLN